MATRQDKGVFVRLPADVLDSLDRRRRKTFWSRKAEIVLALQHWINQPLVKNPTKTSGKQKS